MIKITNETKPVIVKVAIELSGDDLAHFCYALRDYKQYRKNNQSCGEWPWLDRLIANIGEARGESL